MNVRLDVAPGRQELYSGVKSVFVADSVVYLTFKDQADEAVARDLDGGRIAVVIDNEGGAI